MLKNLRIKNFKCFSDQQINFNNLTILAGGNAAGKSTVVQAYLLYTFAKIHGRNDFDIRDVYDLDLGVAKSLVSHNPIGDDTFIEVEAEFDNQKSEVSLRAVEISPYLLEISNPELSFYYSYIKYLKAERIGPRLYTKVSNAVDNLGFSGEYTPSVIEYTDNMGVKVHEKLSGGKNNLKFSIQVERWMSVIMGDLEIDITSNNATGFTDTKIKNKVTDFGVIPTLTGFGITYVMPIVVAGLLCSFQPNSVLIVENPEAHLHPMAQSNIGKFLALVAECGVQVIIETHSEHVVDGARIQLRNDDETDKMIVNFFKVQKRKIIVEEIEIDTNGELSYWPKGFFDQKQTDLRELIVRK